MRTVYEPSNAVEGHMLQDLLRQRGIDARLEGAGLQGAVGELPAIGLVRLLVADEDYASARALMDEWEKITVAEPIEVPPVRAPSGVVGALVGALLGVGGAYIYFGVPTSMNGIDYNDDNILDDRWKYSPSGALISSESDRNLDYRVDFRSKFDRYGHADSSESDDNFDGTFETTITYRNGQGAVMTVDTDGDSFAEQKSLYKDGIWIKDEYLDKDSGMPLRVEVIRFGRVVSAEVDTDRDGTLDRRYTYDDLANVASDEEIEAPK